MKIIFMGTPDFAVHSLNALTESRHEVVAVFTQPDKPRDRGKKVTFSPVKAAALTHGIQVEQPDLLKSEQAVKMIKEYNPDCIAVAAYGMILPQTVLDLPEYGCLNVHASLLPAYRGAAPINRCIMNGETMSGITIMQMDKGLDTGDMLLSESVSITGDMTASQLHDILAQVGGRLLIKALDNIDSLTAVKQDDTLSTYAAMLTKEECKIDLTKTAREIFNHVRGLADYPCAYTFLEEYGNKRVKVYRCTKGESDGIILKCGDGVVTLTEIQPEGGKRMKAVEFIRGYKR